MVLNSSDFTFVFLHQFCRVEVWWNFSHICRCYTCAIKIYARLHSYQKKKKKKNVRRSQLCGTLITCSWGSPRARIPPNRDIDVIETFGCSLDRWCLIPVQSSWLFQFTSPSSDFRSIRSSVCELVEFLSSRSVLFLLSSCAASSCHRWDKPWCIVVKELFLAALRQPPSVNSFFTTNGFSHFPRPAGRRGGAGVVPLRGLVFYFSSTCLLNKFSRTRYHWCRISRKSSFVGRKMMLSNALVQM